MPTKPLESVLYRELSKVAAKDIVKIASPLLQELVNHATNALARCSSSASGGIDEDLALLVLYRHMIEMTDGIEVLISQACPIPAVPLLRSSFEALLSMEYILEDEQHYVCRSLCWLVSYIHQRLGAYERLDPLTEKGARFKELLDDDKAGFGIPLAFAGEAQRAKANLKSMLTKPHLQPVEMEFHKHGGRPNWYQLLGGPPNLFELAKHLNRGAQSEILYRYWSKIAHAQDPLAFMDRTSEGEQAIGRLRDPGQIQEIVTYASSFMLNATRLVLGRFRPGEDLARWYEREVRELHRLMAGTQRPDV